MHHFKEFWNRLSKSEQQQLAAQMNTTVNQLRLVSYGRPVSIAFALRLYQQTNERIDFLSLAISGVDWNVVFPILCRSLDVFPQSATAQ